MSDQTNARQAIQQTARQAMTSEYLAHAAMIGAEAMARDRQSRAQERGQEQEQTQDQPRNQGRQR